VPKDECVTPLSTWAQTVQLVQRELLELKGIAAAQIIVTSDEKDPAWWSEVDALGWTRMVRDVEEPMDRFSAWYALEPSHRVMRCLTLF
jgi:hypothetical protein